MTTLRTAAPKAKAVKRTPAQKRATPRDKRAPAKDITPEFTLGQVPHDELGDEEEDVEPVAPVPTAEEMLAREAFKALLLPMLKESLRIQVDNGHFTSPNDRTVQVFFDGVCISEATFDVRSRDEYEG